MTMQMTGTFTCEPGVFTVMHSQPGPDPFDIKMLGLKASCISTACWAGYVASYAMWNGRLFLSELLVMANRRELPDICGIYPEGEWDAKYQGLRLPLGFCGDLEITPHDGWAAWWSRHSGKFVEYRLSFHGGLLRAAENISRDTDSEHIIDRFMDPNRGTPFDEYIIPLTEYEKHEIAEEAARESRRRDRI